MLVAEYAGGLKCLVVIDPENPGIERRIKDQASVGRPKIASASVSQRYKCLEAVDVRRIQARRYSVDLELVAASGISFYSATGDSGSSGCKDAVRGYTAHVVDDTTQSKVPHKLDF